MIKLLGILKEIQPVSRYPKLIVGEKYVIYKKGFKNNNNNQVYGSIMTYSGPQHVRTGDKRVTYHYFEHKTEARGVKGDYAYISSEDLQDKVKPYNEINEIQPVSSFDKIKTALKDKTYIEQLIWDLGYGYGTCGDIKGIFEQYITDTDKNPYNLDINEMEKLFDYVEKKYDIPEHTGEELKEIQPTTSTISPKTVYELYCKKYSDINFNTFNNSNTLSIVHLTKKFPELPKFNSVTQDRFIWFNTLSFPQLRTIYNYLKSINEIQVNQNYNNINNAKIKRVEYIGPSSTNGWEEGVDKISDFFSKSTPIVDLVDLGKFYTFIPSGIPENLYLFPKKFFNSKYESMTKKDRDVLNPEEKMIIQHQIDHNKIKIIS